MLIEVTSSFNKDISKLRDRKLILAVKTALQQLESASSLAELSNLKKLQGTSNYYRLRIHDHRMGIYVDNNKVTIARFLHRKDIYRYFP
ncbi:type II toxin-antitoxin system RelE family toxin [Nemorincola caseinilytica]|uniref:type II toxin-antitoxin system RelE family toxin n=1 Tax=Nemorincola caseinilytica TaxID=2054315 RepID=UPI003CD085A7